MRRTGVIGEGISVGRPGARGGLGIPLLVAAVACRLIMAVDETVGADPNYDEAAIRPYTLPELLVAPDGNPVTTTSAWQEAARPHHLSILERFVYGRRLPQRPVSVVGDVERTAVTLPGGVAATRLQATLRLGDGPTARETDVLVYLPSVAVGARSPVFLSLNFHGNQAEDPDPAVRLCRSYVLNDAAAGIIGNRATEKSRGSAERRWPLAAMLGRGFGMATACCGDIFPDHAAGRAESVLPSLGRPVDGELPSDEPGAIAAWAWGLSRILDWLVTLPEVDPARVYVVGHSRLGKAALWAGATDERFAAVISNESGCGGAALSRRNFGETVEVITRRFPHWFCPAFATYADREAELPCDQHTLLAMAAPRPLYVASAVEDRWADPRGEFLAAVAAEPVWRLFGLNGLGTREMPGVDHPVGGTIGYHVRTGKHDLLDYDWLRFADFVSRHAADRKVPSAP